MNKPSKLPHLTVLKRRRDFLKAENKRLGRDASSWDKAEAKALDWAIAQLVEETRKDD